MTGATYHATGKPMSVIHVPALNNRNVGGSPLIEAVNVA